MAKLVNAVSNPEQAHSLIKRLSWGSVSDHDGPGLIGNAIKFSTLYDEHQNPMPGLSWNQIDDIALSLYEAHPDIDPTHIRFTDLHKWITELPDFKDDPMASTEGKLEAIQMAWLEECQDNQ